jgi:hypothetical protein
LYLMPDPAIALAAMKAVLKPDGIIRANLHSALQRLSFYRAQQRCSRGITVGAKYYLRFREPRLLDDRPIVLSPYRNSPHLF